MSTIRKGALGTAGKHRRAGLLADVADLVWTVTAAFDSYRPELHYMRGPGPKWHAKHDPAPAAMSENLPGLVRVRAR
jgi:hypothetical protein